MQEYEYLVICVPGPLGGVERAKELTNVMNEYAKKGWEFVCIHRDSMLTFKKKV